MEPDFLRQALFVTAILAGCNGLDHRARCRIISKAYSAGFDSNAEITERLTATAQNIGVSTTQVPRLRPRHLERAIELGDHWLSAGIRVVGLEKFSTFPISNDEFPAVLFARGDTTLLDRPRVAILSSRQPRDVTPEDGWIASIKCMVAYSMASDLTVVSSVGTLSYSLTCCAARSSPLIVICDDILPFMLPGAGLAKFFEQTEGLFDPERTLFLSPFAPGKLPARPYRMALRDWLVAACASVILAADVRPGGNIHEILEDAARRNVSILGIVRGGTAEPGIRPMRPSEIAREAGVLRIRRQKELLTEAEPLSEVGCYNRHGECVTQNGPETDLKATYLGRGFLIHYTRRCPGPWPGQTLGDYCQTLIDGCPDSGHTAYDTLNRILLERVIRAGNRLIRGRQPVVSFTECLPQELESVVCWRKGLIRWSFEPYGIAVRKGILVERGARRVIYGGEEVFRCLPDRDKHFFQFVGPKGHEWSVEKEWRMPGDLNLSDVPLSSMVVILPTRQEAIAIANLHHVLVTWRSVFTGQLGD